MYQPWYYIISPSRNLLELLQNYSAKYDNQLERWLKKPSIWSRNPGKARMIWELGHEAQIKILFICELVIRREDNLNQEYDALLSEILGTPPYSIQTFDRWWTIEHIDEPIYNFNSYERNNWISPEIFAKFDATGMPYVDDWLEQMEQRENEKKPES